MEEIIAQHSSLNHERSEGI